MRLKTLWLFCCCALITCHQPLKKWYLTIEDIIFEETKKQPKTYNNRNKGCNEPLAYAPDTSHLDHFPICYIRVNMHFMNHSDSTKNFKESAVLTYAKAFLKAAESNLIARKKLAIPPNNKLPGLPKLYRYVLTPLPDDPNDTGVYCHYDDDIVLFY